MSNSSRWNNVRIVLLLCAAAIASHAQTLTTLATFNGTNGRAPQSLIQGADGNFYGTTASGGNSGGTVFKMTPGGALTTLYSFSLADGSYPTGG